MIEVNRAVASAETPGRRGPKGPRGEVADRILSAARASFGAVGYAQTTLRAVAATADIDPALVTYYFSGKPGLFEAALEPPEGLRDRVKSAASAPLRERGRALIEAMLAQWEDPDFAAIFRSLILTAAHEPLAMERLREVFTGTLLAAMSETLDGEERALRASLVSSQVIGVAMARYVWRVGAIAELDAKDIARYIAPTIQRYLSEPL
jgi:AcrR family transcriptional regulator